MTKIMNECVSRVSGRMMGIFLQDVFGDRDVGEVRLGLPAGAARLRDRKLIVAATVCDPPMFRDAMQQAAISTGCDVLVSHHGFYPEVLNHVRFGVVSHVDGALCHLERMLLYVHRADGYWLLPEGSGPYVALEEGGLRLDCNPPFLTFDQRADGLCEAAKMIARRTRNVGIM